ncbi:HTH domain-containing protein [Priestia megaterium]|uniref:HTH domain-containing protein n=1 Tax=Priestia megaterium TaxID=1404 RepID=UPI002A6B5CEC|nr:HTH domain-containing protein [Priestia megaterium]MDY0944277.1 HTH domain-containing protein [Priestia megaterium]
MLVKEILNKIILNEMTIKELAELYNVSDRTIQSKIKKLGYGWDSKKRIYHYVGEGPEPVDVDFSISANKVDAIDILLQNPKDRSRRVYRGFYFDDDVLNIIDRVPKSYKSELVNEALRKVFKEKRLLD